MDRVRTLSDRYLLEGEVGRGPAASVFKGRDLEDGRTVAVKLLDPRFTQDPRFAIRFRHWFGRIAEVRHVNLPRIADYGMSQGRYYIVTDWAEGPNLDAYLASRAPLEHVEAVSIARQICAALAAAHRCGIVHRGLKPENVHIAPDGRVWVSDLGLAGVVGETGLSKTSVLASGASYMAPEQACGEVPGPESDLYSLGVLLFEMLTGRRPFEAESAWSLLRRQVEEIPTQPTRLNPEVSFDLGAVVMIALRKERTARYVRAGDFEAALESCEALPRKGAGVPTRRRPSGKTFWARVAVWAKRILAELRIRGSRRLPLGMMVAFVFIAGFGLTFGALSSLVERPEAGRVEAESPRADKRIVSRAADKPTALSVRSPPASPTPPSAAGQPTFNQELKFEGVVEAISAGVWTISGRQVRILAQTEIKQVIVVGDHVKVEGLAGSDGSVVALKIERKGGNGPMVKFSGEVEAISGGSWTIDGRVVLVTSETKLKGSIEVGDQVEVKARQLGNGALVAEEIKLDD